MNRTRSSGSYWLFMMLLLILVWVVFSSMGDGTTASVEESNRVEFAAALEEGTVASVTIYQSAETPTGEVEYTLEDESEYAFYVSDVSQVEDLLAEYAFTEYILEDVETEWNISAILSIVMSAACLGVLVVMLVRNNPQGGSNAKMMDFGRSKAVMVENSEVTFENVAGLAEEKGELEEIVDFLKDPEKYTQVGARIPKGVLLVGPPGTGKTLMAKAIAGEAGVPFFSISGSDFVEMFVGVGASRVRDLFAEAKKNSPCIVFIDEIDAVARRRGSGMGGGHDEREQTLNQLLVEMDGFGVNEGIIVLAATNRVDILDPAIMRPGRFDRKVSVNRPDVQARREILDVHAKNKPLAEDVNLGVIAQTTAGFTGADLENLMNESAILAAKEERKFIKQSDIEQSFLKIGVGQEKKSRLISEKEKRITAYHESGHAILFHLLPDVGPVHTISIIPTGMGAAGYTMPLPEKDEMFLTKGKLLQEIMVSLGGRIAEELIFGDVTTGASQDIKQATDLAKSMVTQYGMSEKVGMVNCGSDEEVFLGRDMAQTHSYGEHMATMIDSEIKRIIDESYEKARGIIEDHMDVLHRSAALLLEKEKLHREEFEALFEQEAV